MTYQFLPLDKEQSRTLYESNQTFLKVKGCYGNVYYTTLQDKKCQKKLIAGEWQVALGYFTSQHFPNTVIRHAFFIDTQTQSVIDPTLPLVGDLETRQTTYYVTKQFTINEYLDAVFQSGGHPDLTSCLTVEEDQLCQWLTIQGIKFIKK